MNELPFISNAVIFQKILKDNSTLRKNGKLKTKRQYRLTKRERGTIYAKTGGQCHVCGQQVDINKFEADHVKSHSSGGTSVTDNFLPACKTCNNYRWHYLPEELQWILKLGVWARTEISMNTNLGNLMANAFIDKETLREKRRKTPRESHIEK